MEYGFATLAALVVARFRRRRTIIFQEHGGSAGRPLSTSDRAYRRLLGLLAQAFVANTDDACTELTDVLGVDPARVIRATLLVPPDRAFLSREARPLPEPTQRPLFLFVGRLLTGKNVDGLLDATTSLSRRGFPLEVWIVGDGPHRQALEAKAGDLIEGGIVRFLGSHPNAAIGPLYELADVFVMPSLGDYRSVAVLEALRFGKTVIDSIHDGNAGDLVTHEVTGLLFDPHESGALEAAMERTITETELRHNLSEKAATLMERHDPQAAARSLRDIISTVQQR
jgi:glycosyltransferase involved in cell wall biosynthesis